MAITINTEAPITQRVDFCWPKPDTRIPQAQRPKPRLEGFVTCEFRYFSQDELEAQDAAIEAGEMDSTDRFHMLVPKIEGLPLAEGQSAREWLDSSEFGTVIQAAISAAYFETIRDGRRGNSARRR